jgi:hypothetical protein
MVRGQAWSMDLVFGVLIFLLAVGIIYAMVMGRNDNDIAPLRLESEVIAGKLQSDATIALTSDNQLNLTRLAEFAANATNPSSGINYESIREQLGVTGEFCIYLQDNEGNILYIVGSDGKRYTGIGSGTGELNVSGVPCGRMVT